MRLSEAEFRLQLAREAREREELEFTKKKDDADRAERAIERVTREKLDAEKLASQKDATAAQRLLAAAQVAGPTGPTGATGPQGEKGDKGDAGPVGPQGEKGDKGDAGPVGPDGKPGSDGKPGIPGSSGSRGLKGEKGDKGDQGLKGDRGPAGPSGLDGYRGSPSSSASLIRVKPVGALTQTNVQAALEALATGGGGGGGTIHTGVEFSGDGSSGAPLALGVDDGFGGKTVTIPGNGTQFKGATASTDDDSGAPVGIVGGDGAAATAEGSSTGGTANVLGGTGGAGTDTLPAGAGGSIAIAGGQAGFDTTGTPVSGGNVSIDSGTGSDAAHNGAVAIGVTASAIAIGGNQAGVVIALNGAVAASGAITASNLSGTNTGDLTLDIAIGSAPADAGASVAAGVLTLQPADSLHGGVLTAGAQDIAGAKNFTSGVTLETGQMTSTVSDGLGQVGFDLQTQPMSDPAALTLQLRNDSTVILQVGPNGELAVHKLTVGGTGASLALAGYADANDSSTAFYASGGGKFIGQGTFDAQARAADGASAKAFILDNNAALTTVGALLLSLRNNGTEKLYVDKDGGLFLNGITINGGGFGAPIGGRIQALEFYSASSNAGFYCTQAGGGYWAAALAYLMSQIADGASAVACASQSQNALTTAGAKLHSFRNAGTEVANIDKDGAVQINVGGGTRPTADASQRGKLWYTKSAGGVADVVEICLKSAGDTYSWVQIATG